MRFSGSGYNEYRDRDIIPATIVQVEWTENIHGIWTADKLS